MKFQTTSDKRAILVTFEKGTQTKFTGSQLTLGYGETKPLSQRKFVTFMRKVVTTAKQNQVTSLQIDFTDIVSLAPKLSEVKIAEVAATAFVMAGYEHDTYKSKKEYHGVKTISLIEISKSAQEGLKRGEQIGESVNDCRELSNTPGGDMTPKLLAAAAKKAVAGTKATVKAFGRAEMKKLGLGAVLGIAKGSAEEPQFIIAEYWGTSKSQKPLVLVGKGVTFDTGGLNLKTGDHMYEMHMDMSGGAAVLHAVALAAKLKVKANVVALVPAVENAPGQTAVRPGDILKSLSGKTIEVLNTDAEGRVIMADAITYAKKYAPRAVVDVATLTGAAVVALGEQASAIMTNDQDLENTLRELGEESGDYVWPFPLWEEYDPMVKGNFGDVPNISTDGNSRYGGVIAGGKFLEVFAKELGCLWAHIDMAPRMTAATGDNLAKGAAGAPVRLLLALIEHAQRNTKE